MTRVLGVVALLTCGAASVARAQIVDSSQGAILVSPGPQAHNTQPLYVQPGTEPSMLGRNVEVRRRPRFGLMITGIAAFAGGYLGNILFSSAVDESYTCFACRTVNKDYLLLSFIPFAGPWLQLGSFNAGKDPGFAVLHILFGILQAGGAAFALWGLLDQEEVYRPIAMPWMDRNGAGLTLFGRM